VKKQIIKKINSKIISGYFGDGKYYGFKKKKIISLVKIFVSNNLYAYGESLVGSYSPELYKINLKYISKLIEKKNPYEALKICKKIQNNKFFFYQGILKSIIASIEIALINLIAKIEDLNFPQTINKIYFENKLKKINTIKIYGSAGSILSSEKDIKKDIMKANQLGINILKIRININSKYKEKINILRNNTKDFAIDLISNSFEKNRNFKKLGQFLSYICKEKILWLEEVLNTEDLDNFFIIKKKYKLKYSYGENFNSKYDFLNLINYFKFNYINLDISHCPISDFVEIIKFMQKNKIRKKIIFHCWGSIINFYTSLELASIFNEFVYKVELPITNFTLNDKFLSSSYIKNSEFTLIENSKNFNNFYDKNNSSNKNLKKYSFSFD